MANHAPDADKYEGLDDEPTTDRFYQPIIHGSGLNFHHENIGLYDRTRELWYEKVGEPGESEIIATYTPEFADQRYEFHLTSSRWTAGSENDNGDYTAYFEYIIRGDIEDGNPPQSLSIHIQPQKHGMKYPDGNDYRLPHGTGTRLSIETTYADSSGEVLRRGQRLLTEIFEEDYNPKGIDWDTGSIKKLETHLRFKRYLMETAVTGLINTERLISWMGRSEVKGRHERQRPGWDIWKFRSAAWDKLGFQKLGDYTYGLKAYSAPNWDDYPESHYSYHPKIEAFYAGRKSTETLPHVDDWDELADVLRHITAMHAHNWIGMDQDDLVPDDFFDGPAAPLYEYESLEGRRDDLQAMQEDTKTAIMKEAMRGGSDVPYTLLAAMLDNPLGVPFQTLREDLDVTQETIRYHASRMEEAGIADRVGNPGELRFKSSVIHETARETMEELNPGETAADQRERYKSDESDDTGQRRQWDYLANMSRSEVAHAILKGDLEDDEVRIVRDALAPSEASADDD